MFSTKLNRVVRSAVMAGIVAAAFIAARRTVALPHFIITSDGDVRLAVEDYDRSRALFIRGRDE